MPAAAGGPAEGGYRLTLDFVKAMLQEFKEQRLIHKRFAFEILVQVGAADGAAASRGGAGGGGCRAMLFPYHGPLPAGPAVGAGRRPHAPGGMWSPRSAAARRNTSSLHRNSTLPRATYV